MTRESILITLTGLSSNYRSGELEFVFSLKNDLYFAKPPKPTIFEIYLDLSRLPKLQTKKK